MKNFFQNVTDKFYWRLPYCIKDKYWSLCAFFNPRQKWLTNKIGRRWVDKIELVSLVAFESIIHFIEKEKAFEHIEWNATPEHKKAAEEFKRAYKYVKINIPILEEKNEKLYKNRISQSVANCEEIMDKIRENDIEIEWMTQEVVEIIAKYRNFLWT